MNKQEVIDYLSGQIGFHFLSEMTGVGKRIKTKREKRGWSQPELSKKSGVSVHTIQKYENYDGNPRVSTLEKIAEALNTNVLELTLGHEILDYLLSGSTVMNKQEVLDTLNNDSIESFKDKEYGFLRGYISTLSCYAYFPEYGDDQTKLEALKQLYQIYKDAGGMDED